MDLRIEGLPSGGQEEATRHPHADCKYFWAQRESFRPEAGSIVRREGSSGSRHNKKRKTDRGEPENSAIVNREG